MCPRGRRLFAGDGGWTETARFSCNCLLIESDDGLVHELPPEIGIGGGWPGALGRVMNEAGHLRTLPHLHELEAFFAAPLQRAR